MRFECDSCHAKYKISDEKVRGRVVRFPCRKCDHKILIDGRRGDPEITVPAGAAYGFEEVTRKSGSATSLGHEAPTARARRPSSPVRRRPPSVPPRRPPAVSRRLSSTPAAASSALIGQHPGLAPPVPARTGTPIGLAEWHVSINDVPLGPIRLEEISHKIDAGAVSEYTLVWREGFDEWRPLATVPELMALLHERRHSGPPPRTSFSSMPPFVDSHTAVSRPQKRAAPLSPPMLTQAGAKDVPADFAPLADALQPETDALDEVSQPPAPIGPAGVFQPSPQLGSFSGLPAAPDDQVSVPSVPPQAAAATAEPRSGLSLGVLAVIIAVAVFSGVAAFLAFEKFGDSLLKDLLGAGKPAGVATPVSASIDPRPPKGSDVGGEEAATAEEVAAEDDEQSIEGEEAEAPADATASPGEVVEDEGADGEEAEPQLPLALEPPNPADDGPKIAPAPPRKPKARRAPRPTPVAAAPEAGDSLSDEERKLLDDFGSSADTTPAKIDVERSASTQSKDPPLDGAGVRATVTTNKPRLQRCYERAIRGQQSAPSVRLDVSVTVSASGRVKEVSASGDGPGGLAECVEASVRRWRFPSSSEGGPAKFPIVFSSN